jgi:hypothetical protein
VRESAGEFDGHSSTLSQFRAMRGAADRRAGASLHSIDH